MRGWLIWMAVYLIGLAIHVALFGSPDLSSVMFGALVVTVSVTIEEAQ